MDELKILKLFRFISQRYKWLNCWFEIIFCFECLYLILCGSLSMEKENYKILLYNIFFRRNNYFKKIQNTVNQSRRTLLVMFLFFNRLCEYLQDAVGCSSHEPVNCPKRRGRESATITNTWPPQRLSSFEDDSCLRTWDGLRKQYRALQIRL